MTLRLTLIRHCKSSWNGDEDDIDRPLNKRGHQAAKALGRWLADDMPEEVICSTALRARETWAGIADAAQGGVAPRIDSRLYLAEPETILTVLREVGADHVALVGHNPGLAMFATRILVARPEHPRFGDYPTGATTQITFDAETWREVSWGTGRVHDFVVPRELKKLSDRGSD